MRIVQLSDLHLRPGLLYSGLDPWACLDLALHRVARLDPVPDLLLLSGDLADDGALVTYKRLAERLAVSGLAHAVLPGNHDSREAFRTAFPGQNWSHPNLCCQRIDVDGRSLLLLDTLLPGEEGGAITAEHVAWLEGHCPVQRPVMLVLHHPPFAVGIPGMDVIGCGGGELLAAWLAGRPLVEALLCGHVHRHVTTLFAGRIAMTAPATVHQIALCDGPLAYTLEPGGMLGHDCPPGEALLTHYLPLAAAGTKVYS
jgi:3',5'-cyclic AMP phosphodiesterase CpdA